MPEPITITAAIAAIGEAVAAAIEAIGAMTSPVSKMPPLDPLLPNRMRKTGHR